MTYFNQFHQEASERKMQKIAESKLSPMNSVDAANYMKRNVEIASHMYFASASPATNRAMNGISHG